MEDIIRKLDELKKMAIKVWSGEDYVALTFAIFKTLEI